MRIAFIQTLIELAERDSRVVLLTGDLGFSVMEPYVEKFPDRFFNMGVAEQNMVGVATGLAEAGFLPFVYSIATFATLRPYETFRSGALLHDLPVRIVGVGGGFEYGTAGLTHYALEDIAIMRAQPGLTVVAPADHEQARQALLATWNLAGPVYYRLGKDDKTVVTGLQGRFELGRVQTVREGSDLVFVTLGAIASKGVIAAEELAVEGISCAVVVVAGVQPVPVADLCELLAGFPAAITVEAHYLNGGIGSLVAEIISEHGLNCRLTRCGVHDMPRGVSGSQEFMEAAWNLSSNALVETARSVMKRSDVEPPRSRTAGFSSTAFPPMVKETSCQAGHE